MLQVALYTVTVPWKINVVIGKRSLKPSHHLTQYCYSLRISMKEMFHTKTFIYVSAVLSKMVTYVKFTIVVKYITPTREDT